MNHSLFLLLFFFGWISCDRPLTGPENEYWKNYCGTMPSHTSKFIDEKRHLYGGEPINGDRAPWAVQAGRREALCSGTLISQRHVLLASHCIMMSTDSAPPTVKQSEWFCDGDDLILKQDNDYYYVKDSRGQLLSNRVSKMILFNFCYNKVVDYDDFMIMELKEDIQPSEFAYPACITNDLNFQQNGLTIRVTAYGHDNWDPNNTNGQGTSALRNGVFKIGGPWRDWRGFTIYDEHRRTETRPGDSGGSVIHYSNGRYYVIGVIDVCWYGSFTSGIGSVATHYNRICYHTGRCN